MIPSAGGVARGGSTADAPTPPAEAHPASPQTVRYHDEDSTAAAPYHESNSVTVYPQPSAGRSCPARASPFGQPHCGASPYFERALSDRHVHVMQARSAEIKRVVRSR